MLKDYEIIDSRGVDKFKKKTFSGYKKADVFKTLFKCIESKKVENSCNWLIECIISGYIIDLWEKLLLYSIKVININNPNLPNILYKNNILFNNICSRYNLKNNKEEILLLRNNDEIRNIFISLLGLILQSDKNKRYDEYPKLNDEDFNMENIMKRATSKLNLLPSNFIHFNEPVELKLIFNELYYSFKNTDNNGYEKSIYWILWLIQWEKMNKKKLSNWTIDDRNEDIKKQHRSDVVWLIWELIFLELNDKDKNTVKQVKSLYELFIDNYSLNKKIKRLPLIYQSILYLLQKIDYSIKPLNNIDIYLKLQLNVNTLFKIKKTNEINDIKLVPKKKVKKKKEKNVKELEKEKCLDKLNIFNNIDGV